MSPAGRSSSNGVLLAGFAAADDVAISSLGSRQPFLSHPASRGMAAGCLVACWPAAAAADCCSLSTAARLAPLLAWHCCSLGGKVKVKDPFGERSEDEGVAGLNKYAIAAQSALVNHHQTPPSGEGPLS